MPTLTLPPVHEIAAAGEQLGSFMSELDEFDRLVKEMLTDPVSLSDAVFLAENGVEPPDEPEVKVDQAAWARLMVLANDALFEAELMRDQAETIRRNLNTLYREHVIDAARDQGHKLDRPV